MKGIIITKTTRLCSGDCSSTSCDDCSCSRRTVDDDNDNDRAPSMVRNGGIILVIIIVACVTMRGNREKTKATVRSS